jgi:hypothetical protein
MNKNTSFIAILLFFLNFSITGNAQAPNPSITFKVQGFRTEKNIVIRWLLDDAKQWRYANSKGFDIERSEGTSGKFIKLNKQPIKPISAEELRKYDTSSNTYKSMLYLFKKPGKENETGYNDELVYSLYFVSSSYETLAAVNTASAYIDETAESNKNYTYRVSVANVNIPQNSNKYFQSAQSTNLPPTPSLNSIFGNKIVTLYWDTKLVVNDYFATILEKSVDSNNFKPVGNPIIKIIGENEKDEDTTKLVTTDSILNHVKYYYRIKGLNVFGISGPASSIISGIAYPDLTVAPRIKDIDSSSSNKISIAWYLPDSLRDIVSKYEIYRSNKVDSGFIKINETLNGLDSAIEIENNFKDFSNYFKIKAVGNRFGQNTESAPFLFQLIDSIPPSIPTGFIGNIDTLGIVTLKWNHNQESDLLGYRILKAQKKEDEFVLINASPQSVNLFNDSLPLDQLNTVMYYKIHAVDVRYNESQASAIIEVLRPDKIPPTPTHLEEVKLINKKVSINWVKSISKDVKTYNLYRRNSLDTTNSWQLIYSANSNDSIYLDEDINTGITYYYSIEVVDQGNLKSNISEVMSINIPKAEGVKKGIKNLASYVATQYKYVELSWQNNETEAKEFWIYRSSPGQELSLIRMQNANQKRFVDEDVNRSNTYTYAIKVLYNDGKSSLMEKIVVNY